MHKLRQVVYGNLRAPLLEEVYRHAVERARLGPVLTQLDDALGALCAATPRQLHPGACPARSAQSSSGVYEAACHCGVAHYVVGYFDALGAPV